ncbi:unnamed protein product [Durusdinium trenchii]|uniref:Spindle pole body-associated protein Vik1/Cik1 microtubule binding domain-containing protein n=1 Tax=Durusdinium trenchii TaxID=1381693 RepID=A0ABP0SCK3_9DINO
MRERAAQAEKMLEPWKKRTEEVQEAFQKEQALRKRYHNQMQDMKGAVRVFARIRPKVPREADQEVAVWRRDAFSLECAAKDKKSGPKVARSSWFVFFQRFMQLLDVPDA